MKSIISLSLILMLALAAAFTPVGALLLKLSDKLPILLAVLLAAVFVRLARGMPTIPYDKVIESRARMATAAFRKLISAYVQTFAVFIVAILLNLLVATADGGELNIIPLVYISVGLAIVDGCVLVSIAFLVSSDVSLSRIQADMMDEVIGLGSVEEVAKSVTTVQDAFGGVSGPKITQL